MIHSWLSARKINTFKTSGPKGKGRPLLKSTRWMIYRAESSFQPIWMRRKDFFYISPRFNARTRILAAHQQMEGTGNYRAGICKTHSKEQEMTSSIAVHRVHHGKPSPAVAIQRHKTNRAGSGYRKGRKVPPGQGHRDPLGQRQQLRLGTARLTQHLLHIKRVH